MTHAASPPQVSALQRAWLHELGIPKQMLAQYRPAPQLPIQVPIATDKLRPSPSPPSTPNDTTASPESRPAIAGRHGELPRDLASLRAMAEQCTACALCEGRSYVVFGDGIMQSPAWMVIGEAPGDHDDRLGRPFQGDAGELLTLMLHAIGVSTDESVYFANLVKCRPLGNRPPSSDEIASCMPFLQRQIALVAPKRILAMGRVAAQVLTGGATRFEQLRGSVHSFSAEDGVRIPLIVTHHPASLLLQPQHKPDAWRDLNQARQLLCEPLTLGS